MPTDKNKLDELIVESPPLKRVGAPKGNQNAKKAKNKDDGVKVKKKKAKKTSGGNSREYWIGRLKRDAPDHLARLENGKYKTVTEAAMKAGLKKKPTSKAMRSISSRLNEFGVSELEHLAFLAESRFTDLETKSTQYKMAKALHDKFSHAHDNILYILKHNDNNNALFYISQRKKMSNFSTEFIRELIKTPLIKDYPIRKGFEAYDSINLIAGYYLGVHSHYYHDRFLSKSSLPSLGKIIMPIKETEEINRSNIQCLEIAWGRYGKKVHHVSFDSKHLTHLDNTSIGDCIFPISTLAEKVRGELPTWPNVV